MFLTTETVQQAIKDAPEGTISITFNEGELFLYNANHSLTDEVSIIAANPRALHDETHEHLGGHTVTYILTPRNTWFKAYQSLAMVKAA
jgi:hypothetical protein